MFVPGLIIAAAIALTARFPNVASANLNGRMMHLPADFHAPASIVFVAFVRGQQAQVDSWKPFVDDLRRRYPAVGAYELPTLGKNASFFRGFIDGGMRRGITDIATREATITLYIDKGPFDAALGIASENEITVLLVQPDGTVLWRASGAYAAGKGDGLAAALAAGT